MRRLVLILFALSSFQLFAQDHSAKTLDSISKAKFYFNQSDSAYLYRAKIEAYNFHFSGLMALRKEAENTYRCIFTSETGFKLFELFIRNGKAKSIYVLKAMNNPLFLMMIKSDFLLMLQEKPKGTIKKWQQVAGMSADSAAWVYKDIQYRFYRNELIQIQKGTATKPVLLIDYLNREGIAKANSIRIEHFNIPVVVRLDAFSSADEDSEEDE